MKCSAESCTRHAAFRVFDLRAVSSQRGPTVCERHAREIVDRYQVKPVQNNIQMPGTASLAFAVACIVMHEANDAAAVYLQAADGQCFLLQTGKMEGWMLCSLLSRSGRKHRPLTHEAMSSLVEALGGTFNEAVIDGLAKDEYRAELHVFETGRLHLIDVRAIDAVAVALAANVPLHIKPELFQVNADWSSRHDVLQELTRAGPILNTP
jgi:bifunctional DNase/RNase